MGPKEENLAKSQLKGDQAVIGDPKTKFEKIWSTSSIWDKLSGWCPCLKTLQSISSYFAQKLSHYRGLTLWTPSTLREEIWKRKFHSENESNVLFTLRRKNLKARQSAIIFDLCLSKIRSGKLHKYYVIVFEKLRVPNVFCPHENEKPVVR